MAAPKQKLIIIGDGETGEIAYEYFTADTDYEIVAFSAEKSFMMHQTLFGLPVVPLEDLEKIYNPEDYRVFVAVSFTGLNRVRARLLQTARFKGFKACSYIHPRAFVGKGAEIGDNCFIFEHVSIQRGVRIGDNVTIWTGSSIAHHSVVEDNCFIASQVAVSGFCSIGEYSFLGTNSCLIDRIKIAKDTIVGAGAVVVDDTETGKVYVGNPAKPMLNKNVELFINSVSTI